MLKDKEYWDSYDDCNRNPLVTKYKVKIVNCPHCGRAKVFGARCQTCYYLEMKGVLPHRYE